MEIGEAIIVDVSPSGHPIYATHKNHRAQVDEVIQGDCQITQSSIACHLSNTKRKYRSY